MHSFWYNCTTTLFPHVIVTSKKTPSSTFTPYVAPAPASTACGVALKNHSSSYHLYVNFMYSGQTGPTLSGYPVPLSVEPVQNATTSFLETWLIKKLSPPLTRKQSSKRRSGRPLGPFHLAPLSCLSAQYLLSSTCRPSISISRMIIPHINSIYLSKNNLMDDFDTPINHITALLQDNPDLLSIRIIFLLT